MRTDNEQLDINILYTKMLNLCLQLQERMRGLTECGIGFDYCTRDPMHQVESAFPDGWHHHLSCCDAHDVGNCDAGWYCCVCGSDLDPSPY